MRLVHSHRCSRYLGQFGWSIKQVLLKLMPAFPAGNTLQQRLPDEPATPVHATHVMLLRKEHVAVPCMMSDTHTTCVVKTVKCPRTPRIIPSTPQLQPHSSAALIVFVHISFFKPQRRSTPHALRVMHPGDSVCAKTRTRRSPELDNPES